MLKQPMPECPRCESWHVSPVPTSARHDATSWVQCETCDHVFPMEEQVDEWFAADGRIDPLMFVDLPLAECASVTALVERYRAAQRTM